MTFGTLALIVAVGMLGPLLALLPSRMAPPIVIGEILAGIAIGKTGFGAIHPNQPTLLFLADIGFALLMFVVGTHLPLRDRSMLGAAKKASVAAVLVGLLAIPVGFMLAASTGLHRPAILAVLVAASSAAVVLPILQAGPSSPGILVTIAWVSLLDIATVVAVPLVLSTGTTGKTIAGGLLIAAVAGGTGALLHWCGAWKVIENLRHMSHERGWALELRVSLLVLFTLAFLAERFNTSILIAGFAGGATVAMLGEPRRVADQLIGLGEGFFIPLFFVVLGARIDLRALVQSADNLRLFALLSVGMAIVPIVVSRLMRLRLGYGLLATAELGVPAAVTSIGLSTGTLTPGQAAAIIAAAAVSLIIASIGATLIGIAHPITAGVAPALPPEPAH